MIKRVVGFLFVLLLNGNVWAVDAVSLELGKGNHINAVRVGAIWSWDKQWFADGDSLVTGYWEATAGRWRGNSVTGDNQTVTDLGFTPVFRWQQKTFSRYAPYLEGAIGFHLISPTYVYAGRRLSTAFQFGDHVGIGVRFGEQHRFDLGYRFLHVSNGDIKQPNPGVNFSQIHLIYHF